jgi:quinone-modifying oxidoreductase subunit QmoA
MTNDKAAPASGSIMVVGGGIAGLTTALEAAEVGYEVFLVEKNPYLGGRVAQLNQYFPKLCPPTCGLEINFRRIKDNPRIKVFTLAEVEKVTGTPGNYTVSVKINPRYVNENCTCCGACADACQAEVSDEYNFGMCKTKGAYLPFEMAFRPKFVISPQIIGTDDANRSRKPANTMRWIWRCRPRPSIYPWAPSSGPPAGNPTMPTGSTIWVSASTTTSLPT